MTKCHILGNEGHMEILCSTYFSVNLKLHQNEKSKMLVSYEWEYLFPLWNLIWCMKHSSCIISVMCAQQIRIIL